MLDRLVAVASGGGNNWNWAKFRSISPSSSLWFESFIIPLRYTRFLWGQQIEAIFE